MPATKQRVTCEAKEAMGDGAYDKAVKLNAAADAAWAARGTPGGIERALAVLETAASRDDADPRVFERLTRLRFFVAKERVPKGSVALSKRLFTTSTNATPIAGKMRACSTPPSFVTAAWNALSSRV